ncbi:hypothetical protein [Prevotella denticola]|nr:hypothetical protein [Prevotella denticola]
MKHPSPPINTLHRQTSLIIAYPACHVPSPEVPGEASYPHKQ